jgi:AcrR family transcriptional regulator
MARKAATRTKADSATADPADGAKASDPIAPAVIEGAEATTTRERILEIALDLFIRKGYAATSMREIAAPLGISKAALYYHFPSKAHLMLELHLQMHRAMADLHDIPEPGADDTVWLRFVEQLIGLALRNRRIIEFHFRNRDVFEKLHDTEGPLLAAHEREHRDQPLEAELMALFLDRSGPPEGRVRRLASVGVVASVLFGSAAVSDIPDAELEPMIRSIAHNVLLVS